MNARSLVLAMLGAVCCVLMVTATTVAAPPLQFGSEGEGAGQVNVLNEGAVRLVSPPPPGPLVLAGSESAEALEPTGATLNAVVNPEGPQATSFHFEYGATEAYGETTPGESLSGGPFEDQQTSATLTGLQPRTTYHYRVVATNSAAETAFGPDQTFTTLPPVSIDSESSSQVTATSVRLETELDPHGLATEYRFEYGSTASYGASVPVPDGSAGAGTSDIGLSALVQGLAPSTTYHYRVIAHNSLGVVVDPDLTFTTQPVGAPLLLPDARQWELVSPPEKHGTQIVPRFRNLIEAAEDGNAISYYATGPFAGESSTGNVQTSQALSKRGADGWTTQDIAPPHPGVGVGGNQGSEYQLFSPDLSWAIIEPWGKSPLTSEATERTPYLRDSVTGSYTPLVDPANVLPGTKFGGDPQFTEEMPIHVVAGSRDLSHVVLEDEEGLKLTVESSMESSLRTGGNNYYEWLGGKLHLINVLPANAAGKFGPEEGTLNSIGSLSDTRHAVSADGSRIFWTTNNNKQLYMRDVPAGESIRVSAAQGVSEPSASNTEFEIASSDGSRVFFRDNERLTTAPSGGLYTYEVETGKLTLLTVPVNAGEGAGFSGDGTEAGADQGVVMGASEDGSYLYLVAGGVLSRNENGDHEEAVSGANNLYVIHGEVRGGVTQWTTTFIAALSNEDARSWNPGIPPGGWQMARLTSRVSPDGQYLAFMSDRSLTGYDNVDARSGQRDEEVYEYDAENERLVCASCNPTGARPEGRLEGDGGGGASSLADLVGAWDERWIAASIPGGIDENRGAHVMRYQSRALSDTGQLFFDSSDALVPQDVNGTQDVYEYEPAGLGSCSDGHGCMSLISAGTGPGESVFVDASASGEDVFFVTEDRLVPEDFDNGYDMYDAHVCSSRAPCFASPPVSPPTCTTGDSCKAAPASQPAVFGAPSSATFSGAGNLAATSTPAAKAKPKSKPAKCRTGFVKKHGKCKTRAKKKAKGRKASNDRRGK